MPVYRGAGGAGDATNDATVTAVQAAATSAATSATNAANSATAAANSATGAATSATNASNSATTAAGQATTAAGHATNASTFATNSSLSATDSADSATEAEGYASEAFNYKVAASLSEGNASDYADAAQASQLAAETAALAVDGVLTDPDFITVLGLSDELQTVAANSANITAVANNAANINAVEANETNIDLVAANISDIGIVAEKEADIDTVAGIAANVTTVAGISANVTTVAGISANVTTVATNNANVTTVATNIASVNTNATNIANINQNAANIVAIQGASANATAAAASATSAAGSATSASASAAAASAVALGNEPVRHSVRPSLLLDFANTKTLDPRITFTRASTGTFYDGKTVAKAEENLLTYSQEFDNATWTKSNSSVTANSLAAPDGTTTADTLTSTNSVSTEVGLFPLRTMSIGSTVSFYAKAGTSNYVAFSNYLGAKASFDLSTGAVGGSANCTASIVSVGNGWYRCIAANITNSGLNYFMLLPKDTNIGASEPWGTGACASGNYIYIWGAQLEQRSSVTAYTATTTAPITNYIPALQTAAAGVARFEHNPVTGESLGLEIEEQRTNLALYSSQFDDASWTKNRASVTSNTVVAPDGTLIGDKLVEDTTATNTHEILRQPTIASSTAHTFTAYVKAAERTWVFLNMNNPGVADFRTWFNLSTGAVGTNAAGTTASITSVGNGWYRLSVTRTSGAAQTATMIQIGLATADNVSNYTGDGFSGVFIWGAQLEAGAFATSYIPTVASQVTRSADAASMTGTNFSSWYRADEGTMYGEVALVGGTNGVSSYISFLSDGSTSNRITLGYYNNGVSNFSGTSVFVGGSSQVSINAVLGLSPNVTSKNVITYARNDFAFSKDAATVITDTSGNIPVINTLHIGQRVGNNDYLNGTIKKFAFYPKRLTNAELQGVTTV